MLPAVYRGLLIAISFFTTCENAVSHEQIATKEAATSSYSLPLLDSVEFLSEEVVQIHSDSGNSIWDIKHNFAIAHNSHDFESDGIVDYCLQTKTTLYSKKGGQLFIQRHQEQSCQSFGPADLFLHETDFSESGDAVLVVGEDLQTETPIARSLSTRDGSILWQESGESNTRFISLHKSNRLLRFDKKQGQTHYQSLSLIDTQTGETRAQIDTSAFKLDPLFQFEKDPLDRIFLCAGPTDWTLLVNAAADTIVTLKDGNHPALNSLSRDATRIAMRNGASDSSLKIRDTTTGQIVASVSDFLPDLPPLNVPSAYALSPCGQSIYTHHEPGLIRKWNVATQALESEYKHSDYQYTELTVSADETMIYASLTPRFGDTTIVAFDLESNSSSPLFVRSKSDKAGKPVEWASSNSSNEFGFSPDRSVYYFADQGIVYFYDATNNKQLGILPYQSLELASLKPPPSSI